MFVLWWEAALTYWDKDADFDGALSRFHGQLILFQDYHLRRKSKESSRHRKRQRQNWVEPCRSRVAKEQMSEAFCSQETETGGKKKEQSVSLLGFRFWQDDKAWEDNRVLFMVTTSQPASESKKFDSSFLEACQLFFSGLEHWKQKQTIPSWYNVTVEHECPNSGLRKAASKSLVKFRLMCLCEETGKAHLLSGFMWTQQLYPGLLSGP